MAGKTVFKLFLLLACIEPLCKQVVTHFPQNCGLREASGNLEHGEYHSEYHKNIKDGCCERVAAWHQALLLPRSGRVVLA